MARFKAGERTSDATGQRWWSGMTELSARTFFDPEVLEDPFAWYQQALSTAPILNLDGMFLVVSHKLVSEAAGRVEDFSSDFSAMMNGSRTADPEIQAIMAEGWPQVNTLLTADPPVHTRFRKLVNLAFSMPRVNALESHIRSIVRGLLMMTVPCLTHWTASLFLDGIRHVVTIASA